jgi:hypothetical protein
MTAAIREDKNYASPTGVVIITIACISDTHGEILLDNLV